MTTNILATVDNYLKSITEDRQRALKELRKKIRTIIPPVRPLIISTLQSNTLQNTSTATSKKPSKRAGIGDSREGTN